MLDKNLYNAWLEINTQNLVDNLALIRRHLSSNTTIMAMVKGNAYGHGAVGVVNILEEKGIGHFGVATLAEGYKLRQHGCNSQILILGALLEDQLELAITQHLAFIVHTPEHIRFVNAIADKLGLLADVHLKVDTGMGRAGISLDNVAVTYDLLEQSPAINLVGICTHLATSDQPDCTHVKQQLRHFENLHQRFLRRGSHHQPLFHVANSDAILTYPESHVDMVRPGIALYGYSSSPGMLLKPVMALKARITQTKTVPKGTFAGYGRTWHAERDSKLALLPVGYADGLWRALSNRQEVLIKGQRVPMIGTISMDQTILDVTEVPDVEPGTLVTVLGTDGPEHIDAWEWARKLKTIPYEILTGMGERLPRYLSHEYPPPLV